MGLMQPKATSCTSEAISEHQKPQHIVSAKVQMLWTFRQSNIHKKLSSSILREICVCLGTLEFLPWIRSNTLQIYQIGRGQRIEATVSHSFSDASMFCEVDEYTVFCLDGNKGYLLELADYKLTQVECSHRIRYLCGLIKNRGVVYAFGGHNVLIAQSCCEKLELSNRTWTYLPDMQHPSFGFSPCLYKGIVYLSDTSIQFWEYLEGFNTLTEHFFKLPVHLPYAFSNSVAFVSSEELVIVTDINVYRWTILSDERSFQVSGLRNGGEEVGSVCPPVVIGRKAYWVKLDSPEISVFDLDTNAITNPR